MTYAKLTPMHQLKSALPSKALQSLLLLIAIKEQLFTRRVQAMLCNRAIADFRKDYLTLQIGLVVFLT